MDESKKIKRKEIQIKCNRNLIDNLLENNKLSSVDLFYLVKHLSLDNERLLKEIEELKGGDCD